MVAAEFVGLPVVASVAEDVGHYLQVSFVVEDVADDVDLVDAFGPQDAVEEILPSIFRRPKSFSYSLLYILKRLRKLSRYIGRRKQKRIKIIHLTQRQIRQFDGMIRLFIIKQLMHILRTSDQCVRSADSTNSINPLSDQLLHRRAGINRIMLIETLEAEHFVESLGSFQLVQARGVS